MNILAYDTSTDRLTAAAARRGKLLCEIENASDARHSAALVPLLQKLLKKVGWTPAQVDLIAVGVGPGSFTGIRVGVATAQMLSLAWKKPAVGISSLEALAYSSGLGAVAVDARRGKVYAALYERKNGAWAERLAPALTTSEEFSKKTGLEAAVLERPDVHAGAIACAAHERARSGRLGRTGALSALYLHPKDCNVTLKRR